MGKVMTLGSWGWWDEYIHNPYSTANNSAENLLIYHKILFCRIGRSRNVTSVYPQLDVLLKHPFSYVTAFLLGLWVRTTVPSSHSFAYFAFFLILRKKKENPPALLIASCIYPPSACNPALSMQKGPVDGAEPHPPPPSSRSLLRRPPPPREKELHTQHAAAATGEPDTARYVRSRSSFRVVGGSSSPDNAPPAASEAASMPFPALVAPRDEARLVPRAFSVWVFLRRLREEGERTRKGGVVVAPRTAAGGLRFWTLFRCFLSAACGEVGACRRRSIAVLKEKLRWARPCGMTVCPDRLDRKDRADLSLAEKMSVYVVGDCWSRWAAVGPRVHG